jgi:UDP-glucose:glycoprotein glucosyltransferase
MVLQAVLLYFEPEAVFHHAANVLNLAANNPGASIEQLLHRMESRFTWGVVRTMVMSASVQKQVENQMALATTVLGLARGQSALVSNGRLYGPFQSEDRITAVDLAMLDAHLQEGGKAKAVAELIGTEFPEKHEDDGAAHQSRLVRNVAAILAEAAERSSVNGRPQQRLDRRHLDGLQYHHSAVTVPVVSAPQGGSAHHRVLAIVDPLSPDAQRVVPLLRMLVESTQVELTLLLNPIVKVSEVPLKRYYRLVLPALAFDGNGSLLPGPRAVFRQLPPAPLLTLGMETPTSWMVQSELCTYDLDNIHLQEASGNVYALFRLIFLTVEGSANERQTRLPAAGLQLQLGTPLSGSQFDTIVMENLGYFQLKSQPGAWRLQLREGPSSEIFEFDKVLGQDSHSPAQEPVILVKDFGGTYANLWMKRRAGKEGEQLLEAMPSSSETPAASAPTPGEDSASKGAASGGLWASLTSLVGGGQAAAKAGTGDASVLGEGEERHGEVINIFSLASGHLYERCLKIMMLSVLKNTRNPVKFWFLETCMSPQMKAFLPHMAAAYGFNYTLVSYNWPSWLNKPKEKMRLIWAYKILFLDVLFPLDVKKIIFVDADQVVRANMKELLELDLHGAPYGYTPFCDSREGEQLMAKRAVGLRALARARLGLGLGLWRGPCCLTAAVARQLTWRVPAWKC